MPQRYPADKLIRLGDRGFWKRFSEAPDWWECEQHFNAKCLLSLLVRFSCSCFCWLDDYYRVNKSPVELSTQEKKKTHPRLWCHCQWSHCHWCKCKFISLPIMYVSLFAIFNTGKSSISVMTRIRLNNLLTSSVKYLDSGHNLLDLIWSLSQTKNHQT